MMSRLLLAAVAAGVALSAPLAAQPPDPWSEFRLLVGRWEGVGTGAPGTGGGTFTFEFTLNESVLVRRSHSEYPATRDRPAAVHDDLMLIYGEGAATRAVYFDNEKHVIHYTVTTSPAPRTITFTSAIESDAPRYRYIYRAIGTDTVNGRFEIAPPGKPDAFALYVEGDARKAR
jgi:hypothetical protein